ncbi:MAG: SUMF1/EgtB/PvdO family nonheme iron enzyme [Deltaproteobacteria bacterium]|nr:SUMF1/EgtB/PvdO family nonheme iron enzyme [Deltaproteobacteria bacterium]
MEGCARCGGEHEPGSPLCPAHREGTVVAGKYEIVRLLGAGGMGVVYEARHIALDKQVAIKLLHGRMVSDAETVTRFLSEARAAASIGHPGILDVRDLGVTEEHEPYIEMELLRGRSFRDLLHDAQPMAPERAASLVAEALDALAAAHERGIVHRDIKPENLFLAQGEGGAERVKVLDFGIARARGDGSTPALTRTGSVLGTALYMSPEQLADPRSVDARADVYSMGATLFEMLTGSPALEARTFMEAVAKLSMGEVRRSPASLRPDLPAWLDAVVTRALQADPVRRFSAAREMRDALREPPAPAPAREVAIPPTLAGAPRLPVQRPTPERAGRRRPLMFALVAVLGVTLVATAVALSGTAGRSADSGRPSPERLPTVPARSGPDAGALAPRAIVRDRMVRIPGATITMGSTEEEVRGALASCRRELGARCRADIYAREQPLVRRTVGDLWVDREEVTAADFAAWLGRSADVRRAGSIVSSSRGEVWVDLAHANASTSRAPALGVSWYAARRYCESRGARLPTEAEWERIARSTARLPFPWGDGLPGCDEVCFGRAPGGPCAGAGTAACSVGSSPRDRTADDVFDLAGNAAEWTADRFTERLDVPPDTGVADRVVRGGNFAAWPEGIRSAGRARLAESATRANVGFRCVADAPH